MQRLFFPPDIFVVNTDSPFMLGRILLAVYLVTKNALRILRVHM